MNERNKKLLIFSAVLLAMVAVIVARNLQYGIDDKELLSTPQDNNLPTLIELGSKKCIPCRMMMPILSQLNTEYAGQLNVRFIDVMQNRQAAEKYQITAIPTQIFFDSNGTERYRHEGFFPKDQILETFNNIGFDFVKTK